jgi:bifunctional ADP-heptose synthase (sugar kinase/adenylyltransferase)
MHLTIADESIRIPTKALAVHDVSGAGDTVISVFTLADLAGATPEEAATMANLAAGRVCEEVGVVPIDLEMLTEMLNNHRT